MNGIRVLIADSSPVYKKMFAQAVAEVDKSAAVTYASNRGEALGRMRAGNYDVIVLDAEIVMTGSAELFAELTAQIPEAAVLVAARPGATNYAVFAEAEANGAVCMLKPIYGTYDENLDAAKSKIADTIKISHARRKREREERATKTRRAEAAPAGIKFAANRDFRPEIVLMAASTGGPPALDKILSGLSGSFPAPILLVQHTLPQFTDTLAQELDKKSELKVKVAGSGEPLTAGTVYVAPSGLHMRLGADKRIFFDDSPLRNGVRPAADALFESAAEVPLTGVLAVVLTGMGRDGKKGLIRLKEKQHCVCIAQSEKTCVVYGMPRAVAESGLADKILDLDEIAQEIRKAFS